MPRSAAAPRLGNSLPRDIRMNTNLPGFRTKQNIHFLSLFLLSLLQMKVKKRKRRIRKQKEQ